MKFTDSFCSSCGVYDYFEDLVYRVDSKLEIVEYKELEGKERYLVKYKLS